MQILSPIQCSLWLSCAPSLVSAILGALSCVCCAVRDDKRSGQLVNGTNKKHMVTYTVDPSESTPVSKLAPMALYIPVPCICSHPDLAAVLCELN